MTKIRVLIVDDHPMMREALCAAIEAEADLEIAGQATNGVEAIKLAQALRPDVTVMDLYLPQVDGVEAIARILAGWPESRILVITSSSEDERVVAAVQAGAMGYMLKDAPRSQFIEGVREVAQGNRFLPPEVAEKLARGIRQTQAQSGVSAWLTLLTQRELEVLRLVGEGLSNPEIAQKLHLSDSTVRVHIANIMGKLELESRSQLVLFAAGKKRP